MAEAQVRCWEVYGQDVVVAQSDNYYIAEGFGVQVEHYEDSTPTLSRPAVAELNDVYALAVPNPETDGRMPVYLEAIRLLAQHVPNDVAIRAPGTGPFSLASHVLGTERFLLELAMAGKHPGGEGDRALHHLMGLTTQALVRFSKACIDAGAHIVQAGDSLASIDMISPSTYRRWAFPFEQWFFTELNAYAAARGAISLLHICGKMTSVLSEMAATGAHVLELDSKVDLAVAKAKVGDRVCLMGNLNPVELLWQGTPDQVRAAAMGAIEDAGKTGGFILGSGCEVPPAAPRENLLAMIEVARTWRPVR